METAWENPQNAPPFPPSLPAYPAPSPWKRLHGSDWAPCFHPPNTPGNGTGSSPPGSAASHRLLGSTRADSCKRAEQSPAGQKMTFREPQGTNLRKVTMVSSHWPRQLAPAPSFTSYPCLPTKKGKKAKALGTHLSRGTG